jgi:hypothetical protein
VCSDLKQTLHTLNTCGKHKYRKTCNRFASY